MALWALVLTLVSGPALAQNASGEYALVAPSVVPHPAPAAALGGGLIVDPSFEVGRFDSTIWTSTNPTYLGGSPIYGPLYGGPDLARTGDLFGGFYVALGSGTGALSTGLTQEVTLDAGAYTFRIYLRAQNIQPGSQSEFFVTFGGTEIVRFDRADVAGTQYDGMYGLVTARVTVPTTGTYTLALLQTKPAGPLVNWILDDVSLDPVVQGLSLEVTPPTLGFGTFLMGGTPRRTVSLTNDGTVAVTVSSVSLTGAGFTLDQTGTDLTLDPGQSTTFAVTFAPATAGRATGSVTIASNAPGSPRTISLVGTAVAPATNDDVADATVITAPGTYIGTNIGTTTEAGEVAPSCQSGETATVWWVYTPSSDGLLSVDLSGSDYNTTLTLRRSDLSEIDCSDDTGNVPTSRLIYVPVVGGEPVYIRVGSSYDSGPGAISFTFGFNPGSLQASAIPPGDTSDGATFARPDDAGSGTSGSCTVNSTNATAVHYDAVTMQVAQAGFYTVTTQYASESHDGYLLLYRGAFDPADPCLNLVALDDDFEGAQGSQVDPELAPGAYTLVVTGYGDENFGPYTGTVRGPAGVTFTPVAGEAGPGDDRSALTATPNPTRGDARVRLDVADAQDVTVAVYDVTGRRVATLFDGAVAAGGSLDLTLDGSSLPAGVYVVRAVGPTVDLARRVTVVR